MINHLRHKTENTETKYLNNIQKNTVLRVKNSLLELENNFKELRERTKR